MLPSTTILRFSFFTLLICGLFAFAQQACAQRNPDRPLIEDLLPEKTVLFVQIADFRDLIEKWGAGAGGAMLEDEEIGPVLQRVAEEGSKAYERFEEQIGLSLEEIQSLPSGEIVVAVVAPRRKPPEFFFIAEVGEDNEAVDKSLDRLRRLVKETENDVEDEKLESGLDVELFTVDGEEMYMAQREGLIVSCSSDEELSDFFKRWDGEETGKVRPLSKNRKFITIMNRCQSQKELPSELRFFVDPIELAKSAGKSNLGMQAGLAFLPVLGLDGLLGVGGSAIFGDEDYEAIAHGHLLLASPKKGVLKMLSLRPDNYQPEPWIPHDTHWYTTTSWDISQLWGELTNMVDTFTEEGNFEKLVQENISENIDLDFKADILDVLDGRVSVANMTVDASYLNGTSVVFGLGIKDKDACEKVIRHLVEKINEEREDGNGFQVETVKHRNIQYWCGDQSRRKEFLERRNKRVQERAERRGRPDMIGAFRVPNPVIAVIGESLVITDSVTAIEYLIDTFDGSREALRNESEFVEITDHMTLLLGSDLPCAMAFNQPRHQLKMLLDMVGSDKVRGFVDAGAEMKDGDSGPGMFKSITGHIKSILDDTEMPSIDAMNKYIMPNGWFATSDDTGYHFLWFQKRLQR